MLENLENMTESSFQFSPAKKIFYSWFGDPVICRIQMINTNIELGLGAALTLQATTVATARHSGNSCCTTATATAIAYVCNVQCARYCSL